MGGAASYLGVAGGVLGAYGAYEQGQMESESLTQQSNSNLNNAELSLEQGTYNANRQGLQAAQKIGASKANYAASGVMTNSGSALDVLQSSAINSEMDKQNILHGADIKAISYENQASIDQFGAASAIQGSYFNALTSLAGGGAKAFGYGNGANYSDGQNQNSESDGDVY